MGQRLRNSRGFTLVEIVTVVLILGITIGIFYTTLEVNHDALGNYIARSDLWMEMDNIIDDISIDGRNSRQINVSNVDKTVTFIDANNNIISIYNIDSAGNMTVDRGGTGNTEVLSISVDPANSTFVESGRALLVDLTLAEQLFNRTAQVATSVEVFPRN